MNSEMTSIQQGMRHEEVDEKLQIQRLLSEISKNTMKVRMTECLLAKTVRIVLKRVMLFPLGILFQESRDYAQASMNLCPDKCGDGSPCTLKKPYMPIELKSDLEPIRHSSRTALDQHNPGYRVWALCKLCKQRIGLRIVASTKVCQATIWHWPPKLHAFHHERNTERLKWTLWTSVNCPSKVT